nr:hypothetical protein [Schwartzia sp. (in: firmicutes)]
RDPNGAFRNFMREGYYSEKQMSLFVQIINDVGGRFPDTFAPEDIPAVGLGYRSMLRKMERGEYSNQHQNEAFMWLENARATGGRTYFGEALTEDMSRVERFQNDLREIGLAVDGMNQPYRLVNSSVLPELSMRGLVVERGGGAYFNGGFKHTHFGARDRELDLDAAIDLAVENAFFPEREDLLNANALGFESLEEQNAYWRNLKPKTPSEAFRRRLHMIGVADDGEASFKLTMPLVDPSRCSLEITCASGTAVGRDRFMVGNGQRFGWSMEQARNVACALARFDDKPVERDDFIAMLSATGGIARGDQNRFYELIAPASVYSQDAEGYTVAVREDYQWQYFGPEQGKHWSRVEAEEKMLELAGYGRETERQPVPPNELRIPDTAEVEEYYRLSDELYEQGQTISRDGKRMYRIRIEEGQNLGVESGLWHAVEKYAIDEDGSCKHEETLTAHARKLEAVQAVCHAENCLLLPKDLFLYNLRSQGYEHYNNLYYNIVHNDLTGQGPALQVVDRDAHKL